MPIRHRNPDGSLSYTQTADEKMQNKNQQQTKEISRLLKKTIERVDSLEGKINLLNENYKAIKELTESINNVNASVIEAKNTVTESKESKIHAIF